MPSIPSVVSVVVLAAGEGTRMRSALPKVLHPLAGRSLVGHVLTAASALHPGSLSVVVGHQAEQVGQHITTHAPAWLPESTQLYITQQPEQRGTGDAVRCGLHPLPATGTLLVLLGDAPLITTHTLHRFLEAHERSHAAATVLTAEVPNPTGLGRVIRTTDGQLAEIVEERDATPKQAAVREVNSGVFAFDCEALTRALGKLTTENAQAQEYLTDTISILRHDGARVSAVKAANSDEILGCNNRAELAELESLMRQDINERWMLRGVTLVDPATTYIDVDVELEADVRIEPGVHLLGATRVAAGAVIGPDSTLHDTTVEEDAHVTRSHCLEAHIGAAAAVGPFAYLRGGTRLSRDTRLGAFVESKNATLGVGSKVPHLTYVGDATIGEHSNIGASSVFVNYDGVEKHHTTVGDHVRVGSDTMLVAPVTLDDGAYTAAGSVITEDVPPGALAIGRAPQHTSDEWVLRKRPDSPSAQAAAESLKKHDIVRSDDDL